MSGEDGAAASTVAGETKTSGFRFAGAVAGIGSGLTKTAVGHGFDTIKTRLQCSPPGTYTGALDCLMKTVRNESVFALYKGASPPAVAWAFTDSILMGSLYNYRLFLLNHGGYGIIENYLDPSDPYTERQRLSILGHGLAGLFAGWTSSPAAQPMDILKVNLQLQRQRTQAGRQFSGPIDAARKIMKARGILGIYSGFGTQLLFRSNFFWMFGSVEVYMRLFGRLQGTAFEMNTNASTFVSGGLAAFTYWAFGIPIDNVKNRILSTPLNAPVPSAAHVARHVYRTQGWQGFYAGFVPVVLRAFPVNAAAYFVYESLMKALGAEKTRS